MMPQRVGRYELFEAVAAGGMGAVHIGRMVGEAGFVKPVAIKRMHAHHAIDQELVAMFLDEARLASRVRHPNVVPLLDVVSEGDEILLVMDFVVGASLSELLRRARRDEERLDPSIVAAIVGDALLGLHAAHEARSETGRPLHIVHRDVSPQNLFVGEDGVTRVLDFGIATAASRLRETNDQSIRGKPEYLAPEQITHAEVDRRVDVFAMGVVLWELLTGSRLFQADTPSRALHLVLEAPIPHPVEVAPSVPEALDAVCMRALARPRDDRYPTAEGMARDLLRVIRSASALEVADEMTRRLGDTLAARRQLVADAEARRREPQADLGIDDTQADDHVPWDDEIPPSVAPTREAIVAEMTAADETSARMTASPGDGRDAEPDTEAAVSLASPRGARRGPFSRSGMVAAAALFVVGGGVAASLSLPRANEPVLDAPTKSPGTPSAIVAPSVEAAPATPLAPPSASEPSPSTSASPSAAPRAVPPPSSAPPLPPPPVAPRPSPACNPPYWIDEHGDRRFKPECF
ncbi:MAG: serine/threonine protein kinase [Myxococcales bacterium]|nr:serine/threonine protein kinase [Myxococcales bacterium]